MLGRDRPVWGNSSLSALAYRASAFECKPPAHYQSFWINYRYEDLSDCFSRYRPS